MHQNLLAFAKARYGWAALGLMLVCTLLYGTQGGVQPPNGGTWQGYVLGTIGAVLIVWLALLGVRKRSYRRQLGSLQGWTSAHVYLGAALVVIVSEHAAFQMGWNVHTLAYLLMLLVIGSGFVGLYAYLRLPRQVSVNRHDSSRGELFLELKDVNQQARALSVMCDSDIQVAVDSAIERTTIGGSAIAQLSGSDHSLFLRRVNEDGSSMATRPVANYDQKGIIDFIAQRIPRSRKVGEADKLQQLLALCSRRQALLQRIRRDIRFHAWLRIWLYVHVPVTIALLGALLVHILSVFLYW